MKYFKNIYLLIFLYIVKLFILLIVCVFCANISF